MNTSTRKPTRLWEVVGPAGAGKTSVCEILAGRSRDVRLVRRLSRHRNLRRFAARWLTSAPRMVAHYVRHSRFGWLEATERVYLETLYDVLTGPKTVEGQAMLFDQGPLFCLSRLLAFRHTGPSSSRGHCWWQGMVRRWAAEVDLVVWLDGPDDLLIERVLAREKHHQIKDKTPPEAHRWLQHSRWRLGQVVSGLGKYGEVPVLCFDTSKQSVQEIVETALGETGLPDASRRSDREAA